MNLEKIRNYPCEKLPLFLTLTRLYSAKLRGGNASRQREQVLKLAEYFKVKENDLLVAWLSDKLVYELEDEDMALEALQVAEEKIAYIAFKKIDRKALMNEIINGIQSFSNRKSKDLWPVCPGINKVT